uniref:Uncharacterized protein n=1 Tax=Knipowitschia caucasica TaxID=637954 RepID=A0AAV2LE00_KNICA
MDHEAFTDSAWTMKPSDSTWTIITSNTSSPPASGWSRFWPWRRDVGPSCDLILPRAMNECCWSSSIAITANNDRHRPTAADSHDGSVAGVSTVTEHHLLSPHRG